MTESEFHQAVSTMTDIQESIRGLRLRLPLKFQDRLITMEQMTTVLKAAAWDEINDLNPYGVTKYERRKSPVE